MNATVTVAAAAKHFHKNPSTIRRWIASGCPCEELGSVGRGRGSQVDLEQVTQWRVSQLVPMVAARAEDDLLAIMETALLDCLKRDDLANRIKTTEAQAMLALLIIFERVYKNLKRQPLELEQLPQQMRHLRAIYLSSVESGTFKRR